MPDRRESEIIAEMRANAEKAGQAQRQLQTLMDELESRLHEDECRETR